MGDLAEALSYAAMIMIVTPILFRVFGVIINYRSVCILAFAGAITMYILPLGYGALSFVALIFLSNQLSEKGDWADYFYAIGLTNLLSIPVLLMVRGQI